MDARLRGLYRKYGGQSLPFLINCVRAGHIPLDSQIELSLLPEIAKHTTLNRVRVSYLSSAELGNILHYFKNRNEMQDAVSSLGEIVANYALDNYSSWTLFGHSRQDIINRFLASSSLSREHLEDIFYDSDPDDLDGVFIEDLIDALIFSFDSVTDFELRLHRHILDLYEEHPPSAEVVRLVWGVQGSMLEAVIRMEMQIGDKLVGFFITLVGDATSRYERITNISALMAPPAWDDYMVLFIKIAT